jgi:hypothetical protein
MSVWKKVLIIRLISLKIILRIKRQVEPSRQWGSEVSPRAGNFITAAKGAWSLVYSTVRDLACPVMKDEALVIDHLVTIPFFLTFTTFCVIYMSTGAIYI